MNENTIVNFTRTLLPVGNEPSMHFWPRKSSDLVLTGLWKVTRGCCRISSGAPANSRIM